MPKMKPGKDQGNAALPKLGSPWISKHSQNLLKYNAVDDHAAHPMSMRGPLDKGHPMKKYGPLSSHGIGGTHPDPKLKKEGKVNIQIVTSSVSSSVAHKTEQSTDKIGLKEEVKKLSAEHQLMIDYIYFQGYTQQEVADELEMPLGTVKTRIRNAVNELRKTYLNFLLFWI